MLLNTGLSCYTIMKPKTFWSWLDCWQVQQADSYLCWKAWCHCGIYLNRVWFHWGKALIQHLHMHQLNWAFASTKTEEWRKMIKYIWIEQIIYVQIENEEMSCLDLYMCWQIYVRGSCVAKSFFLDGSIPNEWLFLFQTFISQNATICYFCKQTLN